MPTDLPEVIIYTDGSCLGNPGPGGWAAVMLWRGVEKELVGCAPATTNNRMEMTAVIEALRALKKKCHITVYTDSKYVMNGATIWMANWKKNGWKTAAKNKPVENEDLWRELDIQLNRHHVKFEWVKGHAGDPLNERVDKLAREVIKTPSTNEESKANG